MPEVSLENYLTLLDKFISGQMMPDKFEKAYLQLFKSGEGQQDRDIFLLLDRLFADVDAYCGDDSLQAQWTIDKVKLLDSAEDTYKALQQKLRLGMAKK